ncbi:MAG: glycoside hydrolase family 3 domain protein [Panacagrimonas sp.]|jgi:beta-glucosidase|nr:glycoside hydrolase family 3 N-terminal domain-containing protein [Panacagrimonas sp.]MCC2659065.1 glycoside hydrolase family 3 domain protein [Panacagrimonas sp.]
MSRIEDLLERMTLAEKLGQLTMTASGYAVTGPVIAGDSTESIRDGTIGNLLNMIGAGPVHEMQRIAVEQSRLGIPLLIGLDIIHGHRTLFPIPLGETAVFDPATWERTAREAAREAAADGLAMTFAPMLDVSRDLRWGRTAEGPGEDTLIGVLMAHAKVRGFQGDDPSAPDALAACAKHFCAYGPVMGGREYAAVDISERTLREVHLPPFEAAVKAGVETIMPAFTDLNGIPMTMHIPLLRDYLRGDLGWDGVLVSDYNAIGELIKHGVAADLVEAATLSLKAGVDIDMMAGAYRHGLPIALERGLVTIDEIDTCVRRVLRLKERLGLFDDPYRRGRKAEKADAIRQRRELARDVGARSITMLRNQNGALPLDPPPRRLCVLGPLADAAAEMRGPWFAASEPDDPVSVLAGLRDGFPGTGIVHATGAAIDDTDETGIGDAVALCDDADAVILCLGERANMSGEAASRAYPELPGRQEALARAAIARARARGTPVIAILFSGRPLVIPWLADNADAILAAWFPGSQAGHAVADVLAGRVSPGGRTPISWPRALGQVPVFYGQRPSGRPMDPKDPYTSRYLDVANDPLYPFGHGLGYGRFTYANLRLSTDTLRECDVVQIGVDVSNEGEREAEETVFLFTRDKVACVTRPLLELRGFAKIRLDAGRTGTVEMSLAGSELRFLDAGLRGVFEPGDVEVLVGPCADRAQLLGASLRQI